jgi:hypothetical protein
VPSGAQAFAVSAALAFESRDYEERIMPKPAERIAAVEKQARAIMGEKAGAWMKAPNRRLSELTPGELARASDAGMRIVLTELERGESVLRRGWTPTKRR